MTIHDVSVKTIDGKDTTLGEFAGKALLVVNVASKCGLTPQYAALQRIQEKYAERGFTVLGFPCNQFGGQEPGTNEEIVEFCSLNFNVNFPLFDKVEVNGEGRHPLYQKLASNPDADGHDGDIRWNFEKFVIAPDGQVVARFNPMIDPEADDVTSVIEANLPA
jgi:glutathione peroxidase